MLYSFRTGQVAYCAVNFYASVDKDEPVRVVRERPYEGTDRTHKGRTVIDVAHLRCRRFQYSSYFADNFRAAGRLDDRYPSFAFHKHPFREILDEQNEMERNWKKSVKRALEPVNECNDPIQRAEVNVKAAAPTVHDKPMHVAYRMLGDDTFTTLASDIKQGATSLLVSNDYNKLVEAVGKRVRRSPKERWIILSAHTIAEQYTPQLSLTAL